MFWIVFAIYSLILARSMHCSCEHNRSQRRVRPPIYEIKDDVHEVERYHDER